MTGFIPRSLVDAVADAWSLGLALHEANTLQFREVLGDGRLGEGKLIHDVAADTCVLPGKEFQDRDPGRMCQSLGEVGDPVLTGAEG